MDYYNRLKIICFHHGYERYGEEFGCIKRYLDWELVQISKIPGGAKAFVETSVFMKKIRRYYGNYGGIPGYGFRGGVTSSIVAYLCDITETEPEIFYSWTYLLRRERIFFDVNVTANMYSHIVGYYNVKIPTCVRLHSCADLTMFEMLNELMEDYTEQESRRILTQFWEKCFDKNGSKTEYLYYLRERSIPGIKDIIEYLRKCNQLPKTMEQMTKFVGFVTSEFWDKSLSHVSILQDCKDFLYEKPVFCPEYIYDCLVQQDCPIEKAISIAQRVQSWKEKLRLEDLIEVIYYCGEDCMRAVEQIGHLYCRSQCREMSRRILQMMNLINRDFEKYKGIYDYLLSF